MSKQANKRLRKALGLPVCREPLPSCADPGCYPLIYLFEDGGTICPDCVNANVDEIAAATCGPNRRHPSGCGGWALGGVDIHYEGDPEICDHCGAAIESAYGIPD